ncbi:MAG: hypothetical protein P4L69_19545, partial [Desulfosporosinus sp.]|nr:hypothetical protein [Desulfosporosinus sp.]
MSTSREASYPYLICVAPICLELNNDNLHTARIYSPFSPMFTTTARLHKKRVGWRSFYSTLRHVLNWPHN